MLGETINAYTVAGTVAGAGAGLALEYWSSHTLSTNQESFTPALGNAERSHRFKWGHFISTLALTGAAVGFCISESASFTATINEAHPTLGVAVDHTGSLLGNNSVLNQINSVGKSVNSLNSHDINIRAYLAHNSTVDPVSLSNLSKDQPLGQNVFLQSAVSSAIATASKGSPAVKSNLIGSGAEHTGGVLVFTDDDPVGDLQAENPDNLPIDIVNFGTDNPTLKQEAKDTGGKYILTSNYSDNQSLANKIKSVIKPGTTT